MTNSPQTSRRATRRTASAADRADAFTRAPEPNHLCIECGEDVRDGRDVAEFVDLPGRYFHAACVESIGAYAAHLLARTAPESVYLS